MNEEKVKCPQGVTHGADILIRRGAKKKMAAGKSITVAALAIIGLMFPIAANGEKYECTSEAGTGKATSCNFTLAKDDTFQLNCSKLKAELVPKELLDASPGKQVCWNDTEALRSDLTTACDSAKKKLDDFKAEHIVVASEDTNGFTLKNEGYVGDKKLVLHGVCTDAQKKEGVYFNITFGDKTTPSPDSGAVGTTIGLATASGLALLGLLAL